MICWKAAIFIPYFQSKWPFEIQLFYCRLTELPAGMCSTSGLNSWKWFQSKNLKNLTIATTKIYSQQQQNFNAMIIHISFKSLCIDITLVHNANSKFAGVYSTCILYNKTMFQKRGLFWKMKKCWKKILHKTAICKKKNYWKYKLNIQSELTG